VLRNHAGEAVDHASCVDDGGWRTVRKTKDLANVSGDTLVNPQTDGRVKRGEGAQVDDGADNNATDKL
jgi:hypothetical protein